MVLQNCCGCCSLKTGVLIIAILTLINATLTLIGMIVEAARPSPQIVTTADKTDDALNFVQTSELPTNTGAYMIAPCIVYFAIAMCFLYGVIKEKKYFILPILIVNMIQIVGISICAVIFAFAVHPAMLLLFVVVALQLYFWYVILSFYKSLSEDGTAPRYATANMG